MCFLGFVVGLSSQPSIEGEKVVFSAYCLYNFINYVCVIQDKISDRGVYIEREIYMESKNRQVDSQAFILQCEHLKLYLKISRQVAQILKNWYTNSC